MEHLAPNLQMHWVHIECRTKYGNGNLLHSLKWHGLTFELRCKYDWYFKYRAALMQVHHPKKYVNMSWGNEPAQGKTRAKLLQDLRAAKKRKITEYERKLQAYVSSYTSLFPIEQDDAYLLAVAKIEKYKRDLNAIPNE